MVSRRRDSLDNRSGTKMLRFSSTPRVQRSGQEDGASTVRSYSRRAYGSGDSPRTSGSLFSREHRFGIFPNAFAQKAEEDHYRGYCRGGDSCGHWRWRSVRVYGRSEWQAVEGIDEDTQLALTDKSLAEHSICFLWVLINPKSAMQVANMETAIEATRPCWRALIPFRKR